MPSQATPSTSEVLYPYCLLTGDLRQPLVEFPITYELTDDLTPALSWAYPGDCRPRNYQIELAKDPTTHGCLGGDWREERENIISETIGASTEWSPTVALEPISMYHWRVAGIINDEIGDYSNTECFWTGPACSSESLLAPEPRGPEDGAVLERDYVILSWDYSEECLPDSFQPELSEDPAFTGLNLMSVHSETEVRPHKSQASMPLSDCTQYYWRVTARVGSIWDPASVTRTFITNVDGTCPDLGPGPESTATIVPASIPATHTTVPTPTHVPVIIPTNTPTSPPPEDTTPPPAPALISPSGGILLGCSSQTTVTWNPVTDPSGISEYRVQMGTHSGDFNWHPPAGSPYTGITSTSTNVSVDCGWYYRWRVRAIDGAGYMGPLSSWAEFTITLE